MGDKYISNVAQNIIGKFDITWKDLRRTGLGDVPEFYALTLYAKCSLVVRGEVKQMRPETLGKIAVQGLARNDPRTDRHPKRSGVTDEGKTSLYAVHNENYLPTYASGREVLIELAVTAIVAEMTDILREKMDRDASREASTSEGI